MIIKVLEGSFKAYRLICGVGGIDVAKFAEALGQPCRGYPSRCLIERMCIDFTPK